jgi:hypothetical protein
MGKILSSAALAVLGYHRHHPEAFAHAGHLVGRYKEIQTLEDLDHIYQTLEEGGNVEASASECAGYVDNETGQRIYRAKFRYKAS